MQVGDLLKDINDNEYYIIIGEVTCFGCEFEVLRISDEHVDTRSRDELEVIRGNLSLFPKKSQD